MKYIPFVRTKDRFEIYTLLASGCRVDGIEHESSGTVYFRFENEEKCQKILSDLLSKKLKVKMHKVINAIRDAQAIFNRK